MPAIKITLFIFLVLFSLNAFSQAVNNTEVFNGVVVGVNTGIQNVFGGSFVQGKDILAQEHKWVYEIELGYRKSFLQNKLVAGAEGYIGILNGELHYTNEDQSLVIDYLTRKQYSIGIYAGYVVGSTGDLLVFLYANETKRKFNVQIFEDPYNYAQTDKQGMLKYGLGIEFRVFSNLYLKAKSAFMRVDFGDRATNIDVEDKNDFIIGVLYQF